MYVCMYVSISICATCDGRKEKENEESEKKFAD